MTKLQSGHLKENLILVNCQNHHPQISKNWHKKDKCLFFLLKRVCSSNSDIIMLSKDWTVRKQMIFIRFCRWPLRNLLVPLNQRQLFICLCWSNCYPEKHFFQALVCFMPSIFQEESFLLVLTAFVFSYWSGAYNTEDCVNIKREPRFHQNFFFSFFFLCHDDSFIYICVHVKAQYFFFLFFNIFCVNIIWGMKTPLFWAQSCYYRIGWILPVIVKLKIILKVIQI